MDESNRTALTTFSHFSRSFLSILCSFSLFLSLSLSLFFGRSQRLGRSGNFDRPDDVGSITRSRPSAVMEHQIDPPPPSKSDDNSNNSNSNSNNNNQQKNGSEMAAGNRKKIGTPK